MIMHRTTRVTNMNWKLSGRHVSLIENKSVTKMLLRRQFMLDLFIYQWNLMRFKRLKN